MEFRIEKNQLLKGLYLASGIADRKSTMAILANVLVRTDGKDRLLCAATDLAVAVMAHLPAKVESRRRPDPGRPPAARDREGPVGRRGAPQAHRAELGRDPSRAGRVQAGGHRRPRVPQAARGGRGQAQQRSTPPRCATCSPRPRSPSRPTRPASTWPACCSSRTARPRAWSRPTATGCPRSGASCPGGPVLDKGVLIPRKGVGEIRRVLEGREGTCEIGVYQGHFVCVQAPRATTSR